MIKRICAIAMVAGLLGCSSSNQELRPSTQHELNLRREVRHSLEVQECQDQLQSCVVELCNYWTEACGVEPRYCHLPTWLNACINSCQRQARLCLAK